MKVSTRIKSILALLALGAFAGCLAGSPGTGPGNSLPLGGDPSEVADTNGGGAVSSSEASSPTADATFADASKPYPGGPVAPGADWGGDDEYWAEGTSSAVCREPLLSVIAPETTAAVRYALEGKIYKVMEDGPQAVLVCSGHFLRVVAKSGADTQCEDLPLTSDCGFSETISLPPTAKVLYYFSSNAYIHPMLHPVCGDVTGSDPFIALGDHVKPTSETPVHSLPVCRAEARSKTESDSAPSPWGGSEIKKPL